MSFLTKHWYQKNYTWLTLLLLPLSWIFWLIITIRYYYFRLTYKRTRHFSVPIVIVGNITVGGTGKTPIVIALVNYLIRQGFKPGIVSRGVGGKLQHIPYWVEKHSEPAIVGDEAILLARHCHCPLVICKQRSLAVEEIMRNAKCDIIIADDGLQHYRLGRTLEIAVIDGMRGLGNACLLPAGPLREPVSRLKAVDFILRQAEQAKAGEIAFQLEKQGLVNVKNQALTLSFSAIMTKPIHAVAAIGNPERFFLSLEAEGLTLMRHVFPDHYLYKDQDLSFDDEFIIIMTEKDAVKCQEFATERFWYVPAAVKIDPTFYQNIIKKLTRHEE